MTKHRSANDPLWVVAPSEWADDSVELAPRTLIAAPARRLTSRADGVGVLDVPATLNRFA